MSRFVQLHVLTAYPPANLNRDDTGRPKTALLGDTQRLRVSSQSLKRAWRMSDVFEKEVGEHHRGTRTKRLGIDLFETLTKAGVADKQAREWTRGIAGQFGKLKADKVTDVRISVDRDRRFRDRDRRIRHRDRRIRDRDRGPS